MKFNLDTLVKYSWVALIIVVVLVVFVVIILPSAEVKSSCSGFQYFVFLNQKMTEDSYSLELLNGVGDIHVNAVTVDGANIGASTVDVNAGDRFIITSARDPTNKKLDETFSSKISILYDIKNGIDNNRDTATCTGRVQ